MCNMHMQYDFTALNQVDKISSDFSYSFKSSLMFIAVFRCLSYHGGSMNQAVLHMGDVQKIHWFPANLLYFQVPSAEYRPY